MAVGDVNSPERGSGARYNDGKPDVSLIPLALIANTIPLVIPEEGTEGAANAMEMAKVRMALSYLGNFQTTHNVNSLNTALAVLSDYWEDCARVYEYGRAKYAAWNWAKGMQWSIPLACAGRHALAILRGEGVDRESGLRHIGHFMANVVMARTFAETYPEGDDLPPPELFAAAGQPVETEEHLQ